MKLKHTIKYWALATIFIFGVSSTIKTDHSRYFEISKNIEIFTNLYKEINAGYVDDLDPGKLMRTGIDAMLESLDPFTNYISESEIEGFRYITEGKYNGIGAVFQMIDGQITVTELDEESPAAKANLKIGDQILSVDGKSAKGKKEDEIKEILKGYPGTDVLLGLNRPGSGELKLTVTREQVNVPNVPYYGMVDNEIGYIALTTFTRDAGKNVSNALKELGSENPDMKGLIFDLRGNGGGLLTEAVNVSNVFIPKGELVVTTKGKVKDWDRSFKTNKAPTDVDIPVVVLINNNSASASEIVSGVLQDLDRAVLVGQRSYGKGLVQNTKDIGYNSKVKLTTAKYYIPSGRSIQSVEYEDGEPVSVPDDQRNVYKTRNGREVLDGGGVKPDIVIDVDGNSEIMETLTNKHIVFKFVTDYIQKINDVDNVKDYQFEDWDRFVEYLEATNFKYNTKSEVLLQKLRKTAQENEYLTKADIDNLDKKIIEAKKDDLMKNKENVTKLIEKEIAGRYFFKKGRIQSSLKNDEEISQSIVLLKDTNKYEGILKAN